MSIGVVIPNYNGLDIVTKNFPSVIKVLEKYKELEIIVVDDGSRDEEAELLEEFLKKYKRVKLVRNKKNLGFSSAVNKGVQTLSTDLIVLINTDVVPQENFLDSVLDDFKQDQSLFGVGSMDESIEDGKLVLRGRGIGLWKKGMFLHKRGEVDKTNTFWVSGGSSTLKRDIYNKLGGLDEIYDPFYWEDIDLGYRAMKAGFSLKFEPNSKVTHVHSEGAIKKHYKNLRIKTISYRNQFVFIWKNITEVGKLFSHLFFLPYYMLASLVRLDFAFFAGFFLALVKFPDIIVKRIEQKKLYKKTDKEIFSSFTP